MVVLLLAACAGGAGGTDPLDTAGAPPDTDIAADTGGETADTAWTADADGDGYSPAAGDCDDLLPHVYPGAPDYCDALDQDCDGEPIPDGSCSLVGDATAMWTWSFENSPASWGSVQASVGDFDGDGGADLAGHRYDPDTEIDSSGVVYGADLAGWRGVAGIPTLQWQSGFPYWGGGHAQPAGDVDGDGTDDVWVQTGGSENMYTAGLFLNYGGPEHPEDREIRQDLAADARWVGSGLDTVYFSEAGRWGGDGRSSLLAYFWDETDEELRLVHWQNEPEMFATEAIRELPYLTGPVGGEMKSAGDLDGDGFDELVYEIDGSGHEGDQLGLIEGEELMAGRETTDLATTLWYEPSEDVGLSLPGSNLGPADVDGDGHTDLVLKLYAAGYMVMVVPDALTGGELSDRSFATVVQDTSSITQPSFWADDMDSDGQPELMMHISGLLLSSTLRAGGVFDLEATCQLRAELNGYPQAMTDLTGDGLPERVIYDRYWRGPETTSSYGEGRSVILEGFEVPWNDPTKW